MIPAVLTPFDMWGGIAWGDFKRHVTAVANVRGVTGILLNGAAAQDTALSRDERRALLAESAALVGGKVRIIAALREAPPTALGDLATDAAAEGAHAILVMPPRDKTDLEWDNARVRVSRVFDAVAIPAVIYQVAYSTETLTRLAALPPVFAIKEGSADPSMFERNLRAVRSLDRNVAIWTTNSRWLLGDLAMGADGVASFYDQILELNRLAGAKRDPALYPVWNDAVSSALRAETAAFASYVVVGAGDGKLVTLLTAGFAFLNDTLAPVYGVPGGMGDALRRVDLPAGQRPGILTRAAFLAGASKPNEPFPIYRGEIIRQNLLCQQLPAPPADVPDLPAPSPSADRRARFAQHRSSPSCSGCHQLMDPLGFGLETYDSIGRYVPRDSKGPVDTSGEIVNIDGDNKPFKDTTEMVGILAASTEVRACVSQKWFAWALGRQVTPGDQGSVDDATEGLTRSGGDLRAMLRAIAHAPAFRFRQLAVGEM